MTSKQELHKENPEGLISNDLVFSEAFFEIPVWKVLKAVNAEMNELKIGKKKQEKAKELLEELCKHNFPSYAHSLRVSLLASRFATVMRAGLDQKPLFLAGLLHDYGKVHIDNHILDKKKDFSEKDYQDVQNHVIESYKAIVSHFLFSAEIVVRHHQFNVKPYPEEIPKNEVHSEETMLKIYVYARILAFADFYDALSTRLDGRYTDHTLSTEEKKNILIRENQDIGGMIEMMYERGYFQ